MNQSDGGGLALGIDLTAQLGAQLGRLTASLDRADARRQARLLDSSGPLTVPSFSFTAAQGLAGFSPLAWGPNTRFYWAVQRITVAGLVAASAAVPGVADANVGTIVAATAGNVSLPHATDSLTGFSVSLSTAGTANMVLTVSNVAGGPYVYNLPAGTTQLTITYPQPVPSNGTAPNLAWSATAAAVGNVAIYGLTAAVAATAQDVLTVYRGQSSQEAQPQNAIDTLLGNGGYAQSIHIGGEGIILRSDGGGLVLLGTSLAAANYFVNVDVIQLTDVTIRRYGVSGSD